MFFISNIEYLLVLAAQEAKYTILPRKVFHSGPLISQQVIRNLHWSAIIVLVYVIIWHDTILMLARAYSRSSIKECQSYCGSRVYYLPAHERMEKAH